MRQDWVSNPGPLAVESNALPTVLPTALRSLAREETKVFGYSSEGLKLTWLSKESCRYTKLTQHSSNIESTSLS